MIYDVSGKSPIENVEVDRSPFLKLWYCDISEIRAQCFPKKPGKLVIVSCRCLDIHDCSIRESNECICISSSGVRPNQADKSLSRSFDIVLTLSSSIWQSPIV